MAEETTKRKLSPETEAIIDRLKREGSLTRNGGDGKNSIKTIKINLDKFTNAFSAIQKSTEETARILSESFSEGNTEILKKVDETLAGMTEEQKKAELQRRKDVKDQAVADKESAREQGPYEVAFRKDLAKGLKGMKDGLLSIKKDPWGTLLNIGKWAIVVPILVGAIKGVLDLIFGEGEMAKFYKDFRESAFVKMIMNASWTEIMVGIGALAAIKWGALSLAITGLKAAIEVIATGGLLKNAAAAAGGADVLTGGGGDGDKDGKDKKTKPKRKSKFTPKGKLALGLAAGVGLYSMLGGGEDEDEADLKTQLDEINKKAEAEELAVTGNILDQFEKDRMGMVDALGDAAVMGGIAGVTGGPLAGVTAAAGSLVFSGLWRLGEEAADFMWDIDELSNETESLIKEEQKALKNVKDPAIRLKSLSDTNTALQAEKDRIDGEAAKLETNLANLNKAKEGGKNQVGLFKLENGQSVGERRLERMIKDAEEQRVLFQQQSVNADLILKSRTAELKSIEAQLAAPASIEPSTAALNKKQEALAGSGTVVSVTNNYYNKGGDTVVSNSADQRSVSNSNKSVLFSDGMGGGGRFGGLPTGGTA